MNQPEDHMDELFRKAGELYPLKTDGADWDKVLAGLQQEPAGGVVPAISRRSVARRVWWLALLIPMVWLCSKYTGVSFLRGSNSERAGVATAKTQPAKTPSANAPSAKTPSAKTSSAPVVASIGGTGAPATVGVALSNSTTLSNHSLRAFNRTPAGQTATGQTATGQTATGQTATGQTATGQTATAAATVATLTSQTVPGMTPADQANQYDCDFCTTLKASPAVADLPLRAPSASPFQHHQGDVTLKAKHKPVTLYAGVLAGPDLSTIKWQEIQNPGYSLGFVLGLRFNERLAIEVSALWDHKVYYTSAEYADTKKMNLQSTTTVLDFKGNCNMFEIPISLRYDFWKLKKGNIYATAGFSSYIMMKENYNYDAENPGYSWKAQKSYANSGINWFSNIHLSAGYTWNWAHVGDLRIEPYLKIPLSGVGFLNLPMTSTGLYLGLTRSFR